MDILKRSNKKIQKKSKIIETVSASKKDKDAGAAVMKEQRHVGGHEHSKKHLKLKHLSCLKDNFSSSPDLERRRTLHIVITFHVSSFVLMGEEGVVLENEKW
eukprot:8587906-Ditylum_brightwellii.AAC.1